MDPSEVLSAHLEAGIGGFVFQRELLIAVFEQVYGRSSMYARRRWDPRLRLALERLDRLAGREGAAADELCEAMRLHAFACSIGAVPEGEERSELGVPPRPRSLALFVTEAEHWARDRGGRARLERRVARARRALRAASLRAYANPDVLDEAFDRRLKAEQQRREEKGGWCRVRRALRRTLEAARWHDEHGAERIGIPHDLFGADNPRWRRDWTVL